MSLQRNVQQQTETRKAAIRRAMGLPATGVVSLNWLRPLLESNGISVEGGALVRFADTPDQGGTLCSGLWLTAGRDFWEFAVLVARESGELLEVELFSNATNTVEMARHLPGIQKSFGALAIEVVEETLHG
ncbi:hypothetical protein MJ904_22385 [Massilia sp. MB5]|uniref:hypothetical protein n=1 Tax=Massilia sp. MB5 TaxID=2919578 RepID=UPI001F10E110|nr:hypothetical protein [Massilia sp. MB5]UMR29758.1 hypothetical protein MJ904_22385 [Massilia sp. MB5]